MKISVIIPVYNLENFIENTLNGVFAQTFTNIEVIAVDDGSKDNSPAILDRIAMKEPRLKVIHKENGGVTSARIAGIRAATGDYIGFVDGDDFVDPDMFERLAANAEKYGADISHCGYRLIKPDGVQYFYNTGELLVMDRKQSISELICGFRIEPSLWNKIFKKILFEDILSDSSILDRSLKNNEDLLMNYILFSSADKSVFEDFCPYQYVVRDNSASKGKVNAHKLLDPIKAARIIYDDCDSEVKPTAVVLYVTKLIRTATYYGSEDFAKECRKSAHTELRDFLKKYLSYEGIGTKRKMLAIMAAYFPKFYNIIHKIYLK